MKSAAKSLCFAMAFAPVASSVLAQQDNRFPGWITGCSQGPFGADHCPAQDVGAHMAALPIGSLDNDLSGGSFDPFALEDVLRKLGKAVETKAKTGSCSETSNALAAVEIMRAKVPSQPDLSGDTLDLFNHFVRIVENGSYYALEGC